MVETTRKFVEATNELKELMMVEIIKQDGLDDLPVEGFRALQLCNKLMDLSNKLLIETTDKMDEMDRKLDKLLKSKN